jgi:hypothetical protein
MKPLRGRCRHCGCYFDVCTKVEKHHYCNKSDCQRARKRAWQKNKMAADERYRHDQKEAQKIWRENNPDYWKKYRSKNDRYTEENRLRQRQRNRTRRGLSAGRVQLNGIAKMDAIKGKNDILSGRYKLVPIVAQKIAKMDAFIVEIDVIKEGCKFFDP